MKKKILKQSASLLLAAILVITMLPGNLLPAQASGEKWQYVSNAEKNIGTASYDQESNTLTFGFDTGWSCRMNYTGISNVSGKDYAVEFDVTNVSGLFGVYNMDDTGSVYGVYLDTGSGQLDAVQHDASKGQTVDFLAFAEPALGMTQHPTVAASNWTVADNASAHVRVEYIRGESGTLAGGAVNYYKKDSTTGEYLAMGSVSIPADVHDPENTANHLGVQFWYGAGSVSNITVKEIVKPNWEHVNDAEKAIGTASYDQETDTLTYSFDTNWSGRMNYIGISDVSGKDYAVEFDVTNVSGLFGVYNMDDTGSIYGVYLDTGSGQLDAVQHDASKGQTVDFLAFAEPALGMTQHPTVPASNWTAADNASAHVRVEYIRGESGTLAGGAVNYYKKDSTTGEYLAMGSVSIPADVHDPENTANHLGIQFWYGAGSVSNITVKEIVRLNWEHVSDAEKAIGTASYDQETDTLTYSFDTNWSGRMNYTGISDVSGKDYAVEFDVTNVSGLFGVYNMDDTGSIYGVYLDTGSLQLDAVQHDASKGQTVDFLAFAEPSLGMTQHPTVTASNWTVADNASAHVRVEYIRGESGTLAGGAVNYYKKDSTTGEYLAMGSVSIPADVHDPENTANHLGIQFWYGAGSVSNITVKEIESDEPVEETGLWRHMSDTEKAVGTASYNEESDTITFKVDGAWSSRMKYVGLEDVSGKDYVIEFDLDVTGGVIGVYNIEDTGSMYGVYLDTSSSSLDELHFADWTTCKDDFSFRETVTGAETVHPTIPAQSWDPNTDKTGNRIRVEFLRGEGGTLAGGTVVYYKKSANANEYLKLGSVKIPNDVTDNPRFANYFGIQLWLGEGTVSNIKISEYEQVEVEKLPTWVHINETEKAVGDAVYYESSGKITFSECHGWSSRLINTEITDISGENFAVEFDTQLGNSGMIGISPFYEDAAHFYTTYFDIAGSALDGFGIMGQDSEGNAVIIDDFAFTNDNIYPHFSLQNLSSTKGDNIRLRIECFSGEDGTMAGGKVHFYFKLKGFSEWIRLGVFKLPKTIVDSEKVPNRIIIHGLETNGSISNISVIRNISTTVLPYSVSKSKQWGYASEKEEFIGAAFYDDKTGEMTFGCDTGWNARMLCLTVPDVTGKAFALEFNAKFNSSGILGVIPFYEDVDNWYGVYMDRGSLRIDGAGFNNGEIIDNFDYVDATYYSSVQALKSPILNEIRFRFEYFPNGEGGASGAICKMYFKQMPGGKIADDRWRLIGEFEIPDTLIDRDGVENKIMISTRAMCTVLSDISYTEIDRDTETEYYNGPDEMAFEDGYPEDNYQPVAVEPEIPQKKTVPWWSIVMIVAGGGSLIGLLSCAVLVPAVKRKRQKKE